MTVLYTIALVFLISLIMIGIDFVLALPLMLAWNHVMPAFHYPRITYIDGFCLLVIVTIFTLPLTTSRKESK